MRLLSFWILLCCFLNAFNSHDVKITPSLKSLQVFIPSQESFQTQSKDQMLILTFSSPLQGSSITQILQSPFEKIQILQNSSNQSQIIVSGKNLELNTQKTQNGTKLTFSSEVIQISWGRYLAVLTFLIVTLLFLFFFRKKIKHKLASTSRAHYTEIPLNAKSKLLHLEYQNHVYLIFSNEKGCTLLNHYPKTKDNKEFIDLIKEE